MKEEKYGELLIFYKKSAQQNFKNVGLVNI